MKILITYPASKWLIYFVIDEFIAKSKTKSELIILSLIYKRWISMLTTMKKLNSNIDTSHCYNYNTFMKYKYHSLSVKSYSSDWDDCEETNYSLKNYFEKNYIGNLKDRLKSKVYLVAEYTKVKRVNKKWYCDLVNGIFTIHHQEFLFRSGKARFDF
mmetsp:Transcript_27165/g.66063  ORF Transcript_27165/g.66063 Transcript_27165/m.66063 type:complete len:157 (-) Transcript_27165:238-708(-)